MLDYARVIAGYHGCDRDLALDVLQGNQRLTPSRNHYDWLGEGIYFWEFGPRRALEFAREKQRRDPKKVQTPFVIGAYINLGRCFDLTDTEHTGQLQPAYERWRQELTRINQPVPANRDIQGSKNRDLLLRYGDCHLMNWYMNLLDSAKNDAYYYQSVRGVFVEGDPVYEGSGIHTKTHVQVAVRDPQCILGYFIPTYLLTQEIQDATEEVEL